jgi:Mlc titration factor MtfA (ptsG expression regulator)
MFSWLRNHRRSELRAAPFSPAWEEFLRLHVAHYGWLTPAEQERLQGDIQIFVAEKEWEGVKGADVREEVKLVIAAQACLLLLGWEDPHYFPNVSTIIVYPAGFRAKSRERDGYIETEKQHDVLGQAWSGNLPVIVSWDDARDGSEDPEDGHNVILHEFAHKLDMLGGGADGVPPLSGGDAAYDAWAQVMSQEFRALRLRAWHGRRSVMDSYGAEDEAEFFAVATETFFEKPQPLYTRHPELYEVLKSYYQQDTVSRWEKWQRSNENSRGTDMSFPPHPAEYIAED